MKKTLITFSVLVFILAVGIIIAATIVPNEILQPGTQPQEIGNLESPDKCDNCHGGYNSNIEPAYNWRGSMMANASRDPIFWATLAIAEQDFDGSGDLCIRCHSTSGWLAGRSTPTDGSNLMAGDADGVECDFCHKMTNPDNSEYLGIQIAPFIANDGGSPSQGYYGSGMASMWSGNEKLGPYSDTVARHQFLQSKFHRSKEFCGTCHDVSNPAVGDLAPNHGTLPGADPVQASEVLGGPFTDKAAFNNFPFQYGIVERTFSEHMSSAWPVISVKNYLSLPSELRTGAVKIAYENALLAGKGGDYQDGDIRFFTCQTCHLRPVIGVGCNKKGAPERPDLPLHDMTGGNYWVPDAIIYLNNSGKLRLGGGLNSTQISALNDGKIRSLKQLSSAASLEVSGDTLYVINLTGHKLISGYPEGRRMWLNIKWYNGSNQLIKESGKFSSITVNINGVNQQVNTILDLDDPESKIYEAHYGMTQDWAYRLVYEFGYPKDLPLSYDRSSSDPDYTLGQLADSAPGTTHETFHFVLNNTVVKDNRIPPYGMNYQEAQKRNALPVPENQYGPVGGIYRHFDILPLIPPSGAEYAVIDLVYQPTSWEYIQFLYLANQKQNDFLAAEGDYILEAWLNTGMAEPYIMATTTWGTPPAPVVPIMSINSLATYAAGKRGTIIPATDFKSGDTVTFLAHVVDQEEQNLSGAQVYLEIKDSTGITVTTIQGFSDENGSALLKWKTSRRETSDNYTAIITTILKSGYDYVPNIIQVDFTIQ